MLPLFENITYEPTEYELETVVPWLVKVLNETSDGKPITSSTISARSIMELGHKLVGSRTRKLVHYIRYHALVPCLVASGKGYWRTSDPETMQTCLETLKKRERAIAEVRSSLTQQAREHLR